MRQAKRPEQLSQLYGEIHACGECFGAPGCKIQRDPDRVHRKVMAMALKSEVFLIGQALARETQRLSGLPYCKPDGSLSQAGHRLDGFLNGFGYTIDPSGGGIYAYSSDIVQHYTGRLKGRGDRKPARTERDNCATWLRQELDLLRPRVVLLLGDVAIEEFLKRYVDIRVIKPSDVWGRRFDCRIGRRTVIAFPLPHFSYRFGDRLRIERIRRDTAAEVSAILQRP